MFEILPWTRRAKEFYTKAVSHPANQEVLRFLQSESTPRGLAAKSPWRKSAYVIHVHPELGTLLDQAAEKLPGHYAEFLYGFDVIADRSGAICAFAFSKHTLAFRLPGQLWAEAFEKGGKPVERAGEGWIEFDPWPPHGPARSDSQILAFAQYWLERAYRHAHELSRHI